MNRLDGVINGLEVVVGLAGVATANVELTGRPLCSTVTVTVVASDGVLTRNNASTGVERPHALLSTLTAK
jgi:hypothetical protein